MKCQRHSAYRGRRDNDFLRVQSVNVRQRQRIIAPDLHFRAQFTKILVEVPCKGIIVIDKQDHGGSGSVEPHYFTQFRELRLSLSEKSPAKRRDRPSRRSGSPVSMFQPQYLANSARSLHVTPAVQRRCAAPARSQTKRMKHVNFTVVMRQPLDKLLVRQTDQIALFFQILHQSVALFSI